MGTSAIVSLYEQGDLLCKLVAYKDGQLGGKWGLGTGLATVAKHLNEDDTVYVKVARIVHYLCTFPHWEIGIVPFDYPDEEFNYHINFDDAQNPRFDFFSGSVEVRMNLDEWLRFCRELEE